MLEAVRTNKEKSVFLGTKPEFCLTTSIVHNIGPYATTFSIVMLNIQSVLPMFIGLVTGTVFLVWFFQKKCLILQYNNHGKFNYLEKLQAGYLNIGYDADKFHYVSITLLCSVSSVKPIETCTLFYLLFII